MAILLAAQSPDRPGLYSRGDSSQSLSLMQANVPPPHSWDSGTWLSCQEHPGTLITFKLVGSLCKEGIRHPNREGRMFHKANPCRVPAPTPWPWHQLGRQRGSLQSPHSSGLLLTQRESVVGAETPASSSPHPLRSPYKVGVPLAALTRGETESQ